MDEDWERIAADSTSIRDDVDRAGFVGGVAGGEVGDAAAGVPVPGSRAETAGGGLHIGDGHVRLAVWKECGVCVARHRHGCAFAVDCGWCGDLSDLREVQRDAEDLWLKRDVRHLANGGAGVSAVAEDGGGFLGTA